MFLWLSVSQVLKLRLLDFLQSLQKPPLWLFKFLGQLFQMFLTQHTSFFLFQNWDFPINFNLHLFFLLLLQIWFQVSQVSHLILIEDFFEFTFPFFLGFLKFFLNFLHSFLLFFSKLGLKSLNMLLLEINNALVLNHCIF